MSFPQRRGGSGAPRLDQDAPGRPAASPDSWALRRPCARGRSAPSYVGAVGPQIGPDEVCGSATPSCSTSPPSRDRREGVNPHQHGRLTGVRLAPPRLRQAQRDRFDVRRRHHAASLARPACRTFPTLLRGWPAPRSRSTPMRQGEWTHDRAAPQGRRAHRAAGGAAARVRRPQRARARQAARRAPAEAVMSEIQQRTAEQLFRTLGELKGGAMKFGQAMSVLEAALPDELAAPYRTELTRLQDSAPPMPTQTVRDQIEQDLGPDWRDELVWLDGGPTAAASIGQVHQGRWHDGREVAVKVQYPGAGEALQSDLRQLGAAGPHHRPAGARHRGEATGRGAAGPRRRRAGLHPGGRGAARVRRRPSATTPTSWCPTWSRSATRCWSPSGSRARPRWRR